MLQLVVVVMSKFWFSSLLKFWARTAAYFLSPGSVSSRREVMLLAFPELHIRPWTTTSERRSGPRRRTQRRELSSNTTSRNSDARFALVLRVLPSKMIHDIAFDHHPCANVDHRIICLCQHTRDPHTLRKHGHTSDLESTS